MTDDKEKSSAGVDPPRRPSIPRRRYKPMKYMLLTYLDEKAWLALSPDAQRAEMESCGPLIRKLVDQKKLLAGAPLQPTSTATTVRYREGKRLLTDGPFAETR